MWQQAIKLLQDILNFFYTGVGDYGLAIILLTVVVRVAMLPLTIKQTKSMHDLQRIQPKLKALQEKYKSDKQKMQEEMMKLYQDNRVNPLGGCLPTIVQLPVMIALFQMLREAKSFQFGAPKFFWLIPHLTDTAATAFKGGIGLAVPYIILLALFVGTTYLPQKMMSQDPQQERMMVMMSVFMAFIGWTIPAGVILYWVTTNIFTLGQQYLMLRPRATEGGADGS